MGETALKTISRESQQLNDELIIDEYFCNGYDMKLAISDVLKDNSTLPAAISLMSKRIRTNNKVYFKKKRTALKRKTGIQDEYIIMELINYVFSDVTRFIGLTVEQIKDLPPNLRRTIQSFKINTKTYTTRDGQEVKEENVELKLVNKDSMIKELAKIQGLYSKDNKQKAAQINIANASIDQLNTLNQMYLNHQEQSDKE